MKTPSQRGRASRRKGQSFEREVAAAIGMRLGRDVRRLLGQERDGGCDIDVQPLRIECKRRRKISVQAWWHEAAMSAGSGAVPTVVMRADNEPPMVLLRLDDFLTLTGDKLR